MKLEITKEKVLRAAEKCGDAKNILKELFPEVFEQKFKKGDFFKNNTTNTIALCTRVINSNELELRIVVNRGDLVLDEQTNYACQHWSKINNPF